MTWAIRGAVGVFYSLWTMVDSLRRGRLGVDAIAFLALVGALAVGEYLGRRRRGYGRQWPGSRGVGDGRARHEMRALLGRSPRTAHRYEGRALHIVPAEQVGPGDRLMVGAGDRPRRRRPGD